MSRNLSRSTSQRSIRIVGVDGGAIPARRKTGEHTVLVAVVLQGPRISTVRIGRIQVDGTDANRVLAALLKPMVFDIVMLSGVSFGGFNLVDMKRLALDTRKPVIAVIGRKPNNMAVRSALRKHFQDWKRRWLMVRNAGPLYSCKPLTNEPKLYFEVRGASPTDARNVIASSATISRLPEPVRVAGILAKGLDERT